MTTQTVTEKPTPKLTSIAERVADYLLNDDHGQRLVIFKDAWYRRQRDSDDPVFIITTRGAMAREVKEALGKLGEAVDNQQHTGINTRLHNSARIPTAQFHEWIAIGNRIADPKENHRPYALQRLTPDEIEAMDASPIPNKT